MEKKIDLVVDLKDINNRLDVFIARNLGISRSLAARLIDDGQVLVDGDRKRPSLKLKANSRVYASYDQPETSMSIEPCESPLEILYEDDWIVVINKPAGLVVHPGAGNRERTLVHALLAKYPEIAGVGDPMRPGVVHRLDKLTSGVMVVARNNAAHSSLSLSFKTHEHVREYLALCYGRMPEMQGSIETYMQRHPKHRKRMTSRVEEGRKAVTHYQVIRQWKEISLLRLRLETGRTHQIRVHLSDMGHPVLGDSLYGGRKRIGTISDKALQSSLKALTRQMLHATMLGITHPGTGDWMEFKADMTEDMKDLIDLCDEREKDDDKGASHQVLGTRY